MVFSHDTHGDTLSLHLSHLHPGLSRIGVGISHGPFRDPMHGCSFLSKVEEMKLFTQRSQTLALKAESLETQEVGVCVRVCVCVFLTFCAIAQMVFGTIFKSLQPT